MIDPEEERKRFISIRELVAAIAAATGKTEQQAAAMLCATLRKSPPGWDRLAFYEWSPVWGCTPISGQLGSLDGKVHLRLEGWATTGSTQKTFAEMMNDDDIPF